MNIRKHPKLFPILATQLAVCKKLSGMGNNNMYKIMSCDMMHSAGTEKPLSIIKNIFRDS